VTIAQSQTETVEGYADLLGRYGLAGCTARLINESENRTFLVQQSGQPVAILRSYRKGRREAEIRSELAWMRAIAQETSIRTPQALCDKFGDVIQGGPEGPFIVLFSYLPGSEPPEADLSRWFGALGAISAELHLHGQTWERPPLFDRPVLDWDALVGARPIWGPWDQAPGLSKADRQTIEQAAELIHLKTQAYGQAPGRFGLIHGDLRTANLLVDGERLCVIDFDDCAQSWFLYDLAGALSLVEDLVEAPDLVAAWLAAYAELRPLATEDLAMVNPFIMLRRIQVLSWFASHAQTEIAQEHGPGAIAGTVVAARRFLAGEPPYGDPKR
jgi:Ser/Thr protein kinase RdoA (MazF antagonist)